VGPQIEHRLARAGTKILDQDLLFGIKDVLGDGILRL